MRIEIPIPPIERHYYHCGDVRLTSQLGTSYRAKIKRRVKDATPIIGDVSMSIVLHKEISDDDPERLGSPHLYVAGVIDALIHVGVLHSDCQIVSMSAGVVYGKPAAAIITLTEVCCD